MTRIHIRGAVLVAAAALGLSIVSACGSGPAATPPKAAPTQAGSSTQDGSSSQSTGLRLVATDAGKLGPVVTDGRGATLYRFDRDTAKPPTSNCKGACATKWPPLLAGSGAITLQGMDRSLLGTLTREDGTKQVTLNGWALYYYSGDAKAGDTRGQGIDGVWFASTPEGRKATESSVGSSGSNSDYNSGY